MHGPGRSLRCSIPRFGDGRHRFRQFGLRKRAVSAEKCESAQAIDLTVSAGPGGAATTAFTLRALAPTLFRPARRRTIVASVAVTGAGTATVELVDSRGHRLASWRRPLRAGLNHVRLRLPAPVRKELIQRPGPYWLSWAAEATAEGARASDRRRLLVVAPQIRRDAGQG